MAEEVRHPSRIYPRALFGGLLAAGIIYLLVTFTASMVVPTAQLAASSGPLLEVVERSPFSLPPTLFAGIALIAVSNGALINMIMASSVVYGMADQGVLPAVFSRVHPSRRTPWVAILFATLVVLALLATIGRNPDALDTLSTTTVVLLLLAFIMVNISVLVLRSDEVDHEHFRTPSVFPILGILVSASSPDIHCHRRLDGLRACWPAARDRPRSLRRERSGEAKPGPGDPRRHGVRPNASRSLAGQKWAVARRGILRRRANYVTRHVLYLGGACRGPGESH